MDYTGRRDIYCKYAEVNDNNIIDVLNNALTIHDMNSKHIKYLHRYAKGNQPILQRTKEIRPEINNKIVENHALEIVNFKVGFIFGEPVQYISRGSCEIDNEYDEKKKDDGKVAALNELMQHDNKAGKDRELAEWLNKCGIAYRLVLPTEENDCKPFETYILDPRYTFVVKSSDYAKKPLMACTYSKRYNAENKVITVYSCYSENQYWEIEKSRKCELVKSVKNPIGAIPIIEYINNPDKTGAFETVIQLCDALNLLSSNRLDGIEQLIQSFLWFNNCAITEDGFENLKAMGGIQTKSEAGNPAIIKQIETKLDQQQTQTLAEQLHQTMLNVACVPDRRASAGGNTGQALIIGEGWVMAESSAKAFELIFIKSERHFLDVVLKICKDKISTPEVMESLELHDIDVKFTRNKTDNLQTKTQGLMNMISAGIHPRVAISHCGLFSDPEQVYRDSRQYLDAVFKSNTQTNNHLESELITNEDAAISEQITKAIEMINNA